MAGLVLKLRPRERFMVNGVVLQNGDKRSNIIVVTDEVNVLRLRDAIHPDDVKTPVTRVCYIAQLVLAGETEPKAATKQLISGIEQLSQVFTDSDSRANLNAATESVTNGKYYQALKSLRTLLSREARLLDPFSGIAGLRYIERTEETQKQVFGQSASFSREVEYFKENISKITSAQELVDDYTLLKVSLGALGLQEDIGKKYFIKKILDEGTEAPTAFANKLVDPRYKKLADEFGFAEPLGSKTAQSDFAEKMIEKFKTEQFEVAVGDVDNSVRLAMNFKRQIGDIAQNETQVDTSWYQIMGNTPLRTVFETAFGLPTSVGALDVERQLEIFKEKSQSLLGESSVTMFNDSDKIDELIQVFMARDQLKSGPTAATSGYSALTLLQSSGQSFTNLLLSNG